MKQDYSEITYITIYDMAREIVHKIGHEVKEDDAYDKVIYSGYSYIFDKLQIDEDSKGNLKIDIDNRIVLDYNAKLNKATYSSGRWIKLIMTIHEQIPEILRQREMEKEEAKKKEERLKPFVESLKSYLSFRGDKEILASELEKYGFLIIKEERYKYELNPIQCYEEKRPYYMYVIYYEGEKVAEFNSGLLGIEFYEEEYTYDEWIDILEDAIPMAMAAEEEIKMREMDKDIDEIIKSFKKTLNK